MMMVARVAAGAVVEPVDYVSTLVGTERHFHEYIAR